MIDDDNDMQSESGSEEKDEALGPLWLKNKRYFTKDNKVNSLVRIGRNKYLCLDWDKCRYFTWDRKKKSVALFKQRRHEGSDCITGVSLSRKFSKTPLTGKYPDREPKKFFPFVLVKEQDCLAVTNFMTREFTFVSKCDTKGLLNQKLFKVLGREHEVTKNELDSNT